jgi:hypothetical protein
MLANGVNYDTIDPVLIPVSSSRNVGWAMPTDHLEPKQYESKLFDSITDRTTQSQSLHQSIDIRSLNNTQIERVSL